MDIHKDNARAAKWGRTSEDYARHRPGAPPSFYERLKALGIGLAGQRIHDIGTGTGVLAIEFAKAGALVSGSDIAAGQIEAARKSAASQSPMQDQSLEFYVAPAHEINAPAGSLDIISASQCWWYLDHDAVLQAARAKLKPGGKLLICFFSFLSVTDPIARASEDLVLEFSPDWSGANWNGTKASYGDIFPPESALEDQFVYDEAIPFTRESWRGRMRALRGIGASLDAEKITQFDQAHDQLLKGIAGDEFTILHRLQAYIYAPPFM